MNRQRFLLPALFLLTVARFLLLSVHELSTVEKHALACALQPDLWHEAMGPILPLMMKLSMMVFGEGTFGVRFFAPLLILGASFLVWELARGLFDPITATWALLIFHVTPAVNVAAITFTPTTLGIASSAAVLLMLRQALHRNHPHHIHWWALGASLMGCFLVDWLFAMLGVSVMMSLFLTHRGQRALMKWPVIPILGGCTAFSITLFLAWNSEHAWKAFDPVPGTFASPILTMTKQALLVLSPLLCGAFVWAFAQSALQRPMSYAVSFLYAFTWPLITLDMLAWSTLPWPQAGIGAWIAPACLLLAYHGLNDDAHAPQKLLWGRIIVLVCSAAQSCMLVQGDLVKWMGFAW